MYLVKAHNLSKRYQGRYALQNLSLSIEEGAIYGIIGFSGAGKSTLLRLLVGLEPPSEGSVALKGELGMIFQNFNLFSHLTALGNVLFPLDKPEKKRGEEWLARVGLANKQHLYPAQLSGGEKQRVAIARALIKRPPLLFCDEATSALDPQTTQQILHLLSSLNKELGLTIVLITHEMEVIKSICTHAAVLDEGKIVEEGRVADLFAQPQHPTTRRFLDALAHQEPLHPKGEGELLRLLFRKESAQTAVISELVRTTNVDVNILRGGIDLLKEETIGTLIVELTGSEQERKKAHSFLQAKRVNIEEVACTSPS